MIDQGTEIEIAGLDLDETLDMMFMIQTKADFSDDLGALQHHQSGGWCCTALFKRVKVGIRYVKAFRRWHVK